MSHAALMVANALAHVKTAQMKVVNTEHENY